MIPFKYVSASSIQEVVDALAAPDPPRILAGGTTLVDLMKLNVEQPFRVIDITRLSELAGFDTSGSRELVFGALARMSDVADDPVIRSRYPVLSESLWRAASQQLRNMATLGGNLLQRTRCAYFRDLQYPCNKRDPGVGCSAIGGANRVHALLGASDTCIAVYPGDWGTALMALDAVVDVQSVRGRRTLKISELHREPGQTPHLETNLAADELILRIRVPTTPLGKASTYLKVRDRESYAFAVTSAAVALEMDGNLVRAARIAVGGVATRPWRAHTAEQSLDGKLFTATTAQKAGDLAFADARTSDQNLFRAQLGANTVAEALKIARARV